MALFNLLRFVTPNASVAVSEGGNDLATTAAAGEAIENLDTYAVRANGSNAATSAFTLDASLASAGNGVRVPVAAGAATSATGALAIDSSTGRLHYYSGSVDIDLGKPLTAALGSNVALNNTANYFDGPSIAQGTAGVWLVSGSVSVADTAGAATIDVKLWDGTTVIASSRVANTVAANYSWPVTLSGFITSPAGNLRLSVKDITSTSGLIVFNGGGLGKDSLITAVRIG
jgi:hypothetical protein